jgi:hypothetical protein
LTIVSSLQVVYTICYFTDNAELVEENGNLLTANNNLKAEIKEFERQLSCAKLEGTLLGKRRAASEGQLTTAALNLIQAFVLGSVPRR